MAKKKKKQSGRNRQQQQRLAARSVAKRRTIKAWAIIGVLALIILGFGSFLITSSSSKQSATKCPAADGSSPRTLTFAAAPPMCIDKSKSYTATFDTSEGTIVVALDTKNTPETVNNFVVLSRYHYYDGTQIFRTDPSIDIIQGGGPHSEDGSDPGPGYYIKDEGSGYKYSAGDLVMARDQTGGAAEFFFGTGPNVADLNSQGTYVTFGHTTSGLDVLQKIIALNVADPSTGSGKPSRTVTINTVKITQS
jgi:cyclophilin family peptidyl-prolyl cis-trans isomerase